MHKKGESARLSHSYEDSDTQALTTHYVSRRNSKTPRLSATEGDSQRILISSGNIAKNLRFQLFPRSSDAVEQSISSIDQTSIYPDEQQTGNAHRRSVTKIESNRRQSLLRSPSSRYAIPKFPAIGKQSLTSSRPLLNPSSEQTFLSPPISSQSSLPRHKTVTLRGALGAIMPDLYFNSTTNATNDDINEINSTNHIHENEELTTVDEHLHQLHIRIVYDEHRNDLVVNIIKG